MLVELGPLLDREKVEDLIRRIENKEISQALPGEMELAIAWAIAAIGPAEIEPEWFGVNSLPDAFSEHLILGHETVIEIAALSDAALPADEGMRNASRKIAHEAGKARRGSAKRLSFFFYEESKWQGREALRWVKVPRDLIVSDALRRSITWWVRDSDRAEGDKIRLQDGELDVLVTWHDKPQSRYNFRSSMPPEIRSVRDNYVHGALKRKARQLRSPLFTGLRCVILGDAGSTALRRLQSYDPTNRVINGARIISDFLAIPNAGLDVVAVLSAEEDRHRLDSIERTIEWRLTVFCKPGLVIDTAGFDALLAHLPKPRREGFLSRQLHEQGYFSPQRGRYLPMSITWHKGERTEIRISARALLEMLSGRPIPDRMMEVVSGTGNVFERHLERGETIASVKIEDRGPDDDDDWVVVEFKDDASARPLLNPLESRSPSETLNPGQ